MTTLANRYALLCTLRWLPLGLIIPVQVLLLQARGLSIAAIGGIFAACTAVVGLLELPTGGVADRWGRRPVLVLASALTLTGLLVMGLATGVPALVASTLLLAVGRALGQRSARSLVSSTPLAPSTRTPTSPRGWHAAA